MLSSSSRCTGSIFRLTVFPSCINPSCGSPTTVIISDLVTRKLSTSQRQPQAALDPISSLKSNQPSLPLNASKVKWDLFTGVVLERKPLITQELTQIEKEYSDLLSKYEYELSKKSDHEVRKEKDAITIEKIKSGEIDVDQASAVTAQDEEDMWEKELQQFTPASRITEADKNNDQKSLKRALDSHLLLVIEQKLGKDYKWICPNGKWKEGETLRQTAERTLKEICPEVKAKILGNSPWGFYKYKYPKKVIGSMTSEENPSVGAKIFFYKAQIVSGEVQLPPKTSSPKESETTTVQMKDYLWLRRSELESKLHPEYYKQVAEILIDEN